MTIPATLVKKWKLLRSPKDAQELTKLLPEYSDETFNRALRSGRCNDRVFKVMADFYEEKAAMIKEYL
jgi:hypothetical protein